jgi:thymidylate synthase (FAD)
MGNQPVQPTAYVVAKTRSQIPFDHPYWKDQGYSSDAQQVMEFAGRMCYQAWGRNNPETATNSGYLLNILNQNHYSVIEHASISFALEGISRSLSHELVRHRHFSFSQLSQRYVPSQDANYIIPPEAHDDEFVRAVLSEHFEHSVDAYDAIEDHLREVRGFKLKQARQIARAVMPNMTETKMVVTGNLRSWIEFLLKRDSAAADVEIRMLASLIGAMLAQEFPNVFADRPREAWDLEFAKQKVNRDA